jgi:putative PIN family toxin of toxin-antitoxin system
MASLRLLLDSNLYINYLLSPDPAGSAVGFLFDAAGSGEVEIILPMDVVAEMSAVVARRPYLRARLTQDEVNALIERVIQFAILAAPLVDQPPAISRDQKDDYLIALAVQHGADFLVTRDRDLLSLHRVLDVIILDPGSLVSMLREQQGNR